MRTPFLLLATCFLAVATTAGSASAQCTLTVTTAADGGAGSLRQALTDANANPDLSTICFAIPGDGPHTIAPQSVLPVITAPVVLDGYTQPGARENALDVGTDAVLMIELDGSDAGGEGISGLLITGDGSTVRGLAINRFGEDGITISSGSGNLVEGNFLGTDVSGTSAAPNEENGISLDLGASDNEVRDNLLSGNVDDGIDLKDDGTTGNVVRDNLIGTDAAGTDAIPNEDDGVDIDSGASDNDVLGNVIAGNADDGVSVQGPETSGNVFQGNLIGMDAAGSAPLGNGDDGVDIDVEAQGTRIGGTAAGEGNVIAYSGEEGVSVEGGASVANAILGNAIHDNGNLSIDLAVDGPTANDPGDGDEGPNRRQNFPEIRSAHVDDAGDLRVTYLVDSEPGHSTYPLRVEFFLADDAQEGRAFLGFDEYTEADWSAGDPGARTANLGNAADLGVADGDPLVATATDAEGNTSEFSGQAFGVAHEAGPEAALPTAFALHAAYPNPFNPRTTLRYDVPEAGRVRLSLYDALGREVARLVDGERPAGRHEAVLDASGLASGLYLVRMTVEGFAQTRTITLLR